MLTDNSLTRVGACLSHFGPGPKLGEGARLETTDLSCTLPRLGRQPYPKPNYFDGAPWTAGVWPMNQSFIDIDFTNNNAYMKLLGQVSITNPGNSSPTSSAPYGITYVRGNSNFLQGYSTATYVDSNGLLQQAPSINFCINPLSVGAGAGWINPTNLTATINVSDTTDPNGFYRASKLTDNSTNADHRISTAGTSTNGMNGASIFTGSIYLKQGTQRYAAITIISGTYYYTVIADLQAGTITATQNSSMPIVYINNSITSVGNGWYRVSVTSQGYPPGGSSTIYFTISTAGSAIPGSYTSTGSPIYSGTSTYIYAWGAQFENSLLPLPLNPNFFTVSPRFDCSLVSRKFNTNLLSYTQNFNITFWSGSNINAFGSGSVQNTLVTTDPLSGNTAAFIQENTAVTVLHGILVSGYTGFYVAGGTYTYSIYAKQGGRNWIALQVSNSTIKTYFDINAGVVGSIVGNVTSTSITNAGNGWYRCSITFIFPVNSGNPGIYMYTANNGAAYTGDGTSGVYIWGAQIELASSASTYQAIYQSPINVPFGGNSSTNGYLCEAGASNYLLWNRDATNGGFNKNYLVQSQVFYTWWGRSNITVTANSTTDPLSGTTASTLTDNSSTNSFYVGSTSNSTLQNLPYTFSAYLKAGTSQYAFISIQPVISNAAYRYTVVVDLIGGTITTTNSGGSGTGFSNSITSIGSGWYRVSATQTTPVGIFQTGGVSGTIGLSNSGTPTFVNSYPNYLGTNATIYIWGAQLEQASSASAYQATTNRAVNWVNTNMTAALTYTGIDGVANSCTLLTATASNATTIQSYAPAVSYPGSSVFINPVSVTGPVFLSLDGTNWSQLTLGTGWNRQSLINNSTNITNSCVAIKLTNSGDSIAIDYAQIEAGTAGVSPIGNVSSPIYTSFTGSFRAGDWMYINSSNFQVPYAMLRMDYTAYPSNPSVNEIILYMWGSTTTSVAVNGLTRFDTSLNPDGTTYIYAHQNSLPFTYASTFPTYTRGFNMYSLFSGQNINANPAYAINPPLSNYYPYIYPSYIGPSIAIGARSATTADLQPGGWIRRITLIPATNVRLQYALPYGQAT